MFDAICVGGGPAGAATAAFLARRGRRVLILDRSRFPREKACGEGVLPQGREILDALGLTFPQGQRIRGFRITVSGYSHDAPFPEGRFGVAVRRSVLDQAVLQRAVEEGATFTRAIVHRVRPGDGGLVPGEVFTDQGVFRGRFLVGADGGVSVFHRSLGLRVAWCRSRIGLSTHVLGFPAEPGLVEIVCFPEGELYITPVDSGLVLVAMLLERRAAPHPREALAFLSAAFPERAARVRPGTPTLAAFPLATRVAPRAGPGWILVGDSAGKVDPITGQGLSLALVGGKLAAEVLDAALEDRARAQEHAWLMAPRLCSAERLTRLFLLASRHPRMTRRLLPRAAAPGGHLLRAAVGLDSCSWLRSARDLFAVTPGSS